jgi:hypothetical protein
MPVLTRQYAGSADVAYDSKKATPRDDSKPTHACLPQEALLASGNLPERHWFLFVNMHASDETEEAKPAKTKRSRRGVAISPKTTPVTRRVKGKKVGGGGSVRESFDAGR